MSRIRLPLLPAWLRWLGVVVVASFIFYTSVLTTPPANPVVPTFDPIPLDKWRHFLAYAALGGSLAYATSDSDRETWQLAVLVIGVTVAYGVGIEFWQSFVPNRYASIGDAYANTLGALLVTPWHLLRSRIALWPVFDHSTSNPEE